MKKFVSMPRGARWPWYPAWYADVKPVREYGHAGVLSGHWQIVGTPRKGRVGIRRWLRNIVRPVRPSSFPRFASPEDES